jgi:acyl carrier protein
MNDSSAETASPPPSATEIREWLVAKLGETVGIAPAEIQTDAPLVGLGLDSMQFVVLVGELEQRLGIRFTDNPLFDYPTVDALSAFLADQLAQGKRLIDPTPN